MTDPQDSADASTGSGRAIAVLGGAQTLSLASGFVRWKIIALFLGPAGVGIAGVIDQVAQVVLQIGSLNMPTVALRFLAIARTEPDAAFGRLYRGFIRVVLVGSTIVAGATTAIFLFRPALAGAELSPYLAALIVALFTVPLTAAANVLRSLFSTLHRYGTVAGAMLAGALATAAAALIGISAGGLTGLYIATFVATLTVTGVMHAMAVRDPAVRDGRGGATLAMLRAHPAMLRYSATLYAVGFTVPLGYAIVRSAVLHSLGAEAAGYLAASYTIATGARTSFAQASAQFLTPRASRDAAKTTRADEVWVYLRTLAVAMALAALPIVLYPREVLGILFSAKFAGAVSYLGLFLLAELMLAFGDSYRVLLLGFDDLVGYFSTTLSAPLILIVGVLMVVPLYGIAAAAFVQIGAALVSLALSLARLRARHNTPVDARALANYAAMIAAIGVATIAGQVAATPAAVAALAKALFGLLIAALLMLLLPRAERAALLRFVAIPARFTRRTK